jgi:hypothetical protein
MPEGHQIVWNLEFGICNFPRRGLTLSAGFHSDKAIRCWSLEEQSLNTLSAGFHSDSTQNWACHDAGFQNQNEMKFEARNPKSRCFKQIQITKI